MERRTYKRYPFIQQAVLRFENAHAIECCIKNYCSGGLLLEPGVNLTEIAATQKLNLFSCISIEFDFSANNTNHAMALQGYIRRMDDHSVGIEFHDPDGSTINLLDSLITVRSSENPRPATTGTKHADLIGQINIIEKSFWESILGKFIEDVDEQLFKLAELARSNQQQAEYFEALNQLKARHSQISQSIGQHVSQYLETPPQLLKQTEVRADLKAKELEVLENNVFEDWLDIQLIISSAEAEFFTELQLIHQYFSQLYEAEITAQNNPVGPHVICQTFRQALSECILPRHILSVVYRCFQQAFDEHSRNFYGELISILSQSGINLVQESQTTPDNHRPITECEKQSETDPCWKDSLDSTSAPSQAMPPCNAYQSLRSLKRLQRLSTETGKEYYEGSSQIWHPENGNSPEFFNIDDINQWFSNLPLEQNLELSRSSAPLKDVVLQSVRTMKGDSTQDKQLYDEQIDLVEIVDDLFGLVQATKELDGDIQNWINQLKIPLLKVVLNEPDFLDDYQHPARQVINRLVRIGTADRVNNISLERTVKKHIESIINEHDSNEGIFTTVSSALEDLIVRQESAFKRNAERVAKAYEGQQNLDRAKRHVLKRLVELMTGIPIPSAVLDLLNEGWRSLLVVTCVRYGEQSTDLKEYLNVIEALITWTQCRSSGKETTDIGDEFELDLEAPAVLELVARQLSISSSGIIAHQTLMSELRELLYGDINQNQIIIEEKDLGFDILLDANQVSDLKKSIPDLGGEIDAELAENRWLRRVNNMKVGDWVEYDEEQDGIMRMRLIWTCEDAYKFVFVNHQGMNEIEFNALQLVTQLESGKTVLVEESDISFVDKSLFNTVQKVYEKMAYHATHDPLTELLVRREFEKQLFQALTKAQKMKVIHALFHIDINQFSIINNNYGHDVGDKLLKDIAQRLKNDLDEDHLLARIGGNEYGILITNSSEQEAMDIADQMRQTVNDAPFQINSEKLTASISVGVKIITSKCQSVSIVLKHANLACMSAKQNAGDKAVQFHMDDADQVHHDSVMNWVGKVDHALASNLLQVRCQKIAPVNTPETNHPHYEVLLGVLDDRGELTSPEAFIEAAEQFNRMPRVDRWVVDSTFEWMEKNQDKLSILHGLSINLSGHTINDDSFLQFLLDKISSSSVKAEKLCFEVTETATISNLNYAADFINEVKNIGCQFSLDDFGTGLASYEYLQKLPVDYLKIDGIFIKDIVTNINNYAMVKSINELGHFLGKETIAEFVENDDILDVLREIGVDHAQGYGIEKPKLLSTL